MIGRAARWLWPLVFLFPLRLVADRYCWFPLTDPTYHAILALHERLPLLLAVAIVASTIAVAARVANVRGRIATVVAFAVPTPVDIADVFADEAHRLRLSTPRIAYLAVDQRLCFALAGRVPTIVLSRGFLAGLPREDIRLIARHELLHVRFHDPLRRFAWHLAFAALLFPAFDELERWLATRREQRVNELVGKEEPERYANLLAHCVRHAHTLCSDNDEPQRKGASRLIIAPLIVGSLLMGLFASHEAFMRQLEYLTRHHC